MARTITRRGFALITAGVVMWMILSGVSFSLAEGCVIRGGVRQCPSRQAIGPNPAEGQDWHYCRILIPRLDEHGLLGEMMAPDGAGDMMAVSQVEKACRLNFPVLNKP